MDIEKLAQISSKDNQYLKQFRMLQQKKYRVEQQLFTVEGLRLAEEAIKANLIPEFALFSSDFYETPRGRLVLETLFKQNVPLFHVVKKSLLNAVSGTENSQGIAMVMRFLQNTQTESNLGDMVLIADGIQDPGNLGTLFRTALAAGVTTLVVGEGCVDCYNPKVIRSTMGAIFKLHFLEGLQNQKIFDFLKNAGLKVWSASGEAKVNYTDADFTSPFALVVGSEANGIGNFWRNATDNFVSLPMLENVESLNVSVASGIFLYEAFRQRSL